MIKCDIYNSEYSKNANPWIIDRNTNTVIDQRIIDAIFAGGE